MLLLTCVAVLAYGYGVHSHAYRTFPIEQIGRIKRIFFPDRGRPALVEDMNIEAGDRPQHACASVARNAAVILIMGQSNAANHGATRYKPSGRVYNLNWADGRCYIAEDPLLGASGYGGSPWTRLADSLVKKGLFPEVLLVPTAVGGTSVRDWAGPDGPAAHAVEAAEALARYGLKVTHVLWHQGEADVEMPPSVYIRLFTEMTEYLRTEGIDAPIFVAVTTICDNAGSQVIRAAQRELPRLLPNVHPGPDTDTLDGPRNRMSSECHFSDEGLRTSAALWFDTVAKHHAATAIAATPAAARREHQ